MNLYHGCVLLAIMLTASVLAAAQPVPSSKPVDAAELVRRLASDDPRVRDDATRQLLLFETEPPELLRATDSINPDLRDRTTRIVREIRGRVMQRAERFSADGKVDLLVANSVTWTLPAAEKQMWLPAFELARRVAEKGQRHWPLKFRNRTDFEAFLELRNPDFIRAEEPFRPRSVPGQRKTPCCSSALLVRGMEAPSNLGGSLVVSRGYVIGNNVTSHCVIIANGDVEIRDSLRLSVVIADGDITIKGGATDSCIIARGNIHVGGVVDCTLVAGGTFKVTLLKQDPEDKQFGNFIPSRDNNPLGFITFFELHRIGLEVKAADGTVTVAKVSAKSECEKAGLMVGDVILEAADKKPTDAESLRRLLRDALAIGDATVKLKRGNDTLNVKVALPE